jgi:phosphotransferase system enzyme I (PtsP)
MTESVTERSATVRQPRRRVGLRLIEDIGAIVTHVSDLGASAQRIVEAVAEHLSMEVCSIYVFDRERQELTLFATTGLDAGAVGRVSMGVDEGLTGIVVQTLQPVMAIDALAHPRYKYFPETGEEKYHSFLGVPVVDRGQPVGVLIVQTSRRRRFTPSEVRLLKAIAVPVAGILARIRLHDTLATKERERQVYQERMTAAIDQLKDYEAGQQPRPAGRPGGPTRLYGLGASPGFGIGRAHLLTATVTFAGESRERRHPEKREIGRLRGAVSRAIAELKRSKTRIQATVPEIDAAIFDAQQLMLQDETFTARIVALIREGLSAEAALGETVEDFVRQFGALDNDYFKDRASDIKDIGQRVLQHLVGVGERQRQFSSAVILVAADVVLSDLAIVEQEDLRGMVLASGGVTSHASILAKSLEIPTVVGTEHAEEVIREGDLLIVDGNSGVVFVNPSPDLVREYERLKRDYSAFNRDLEALRDLRAETVDGHCVTLSANIGLLADMNMARLHGAEAVGLYRTEVPFLSHRDFLTEEEQVDLYSRVVAGMQGRPVTIRTLDLGADKYPRYLHVPHEENPFLGWRSIRISLELPEVFKVQLRAILRASACGPVRMMFPMISSLEEIRRVKELLAEAEDDLRSSGQAFDPNMPVGMMMEVPAAVYLAPTLAQEVDFFSIGTNDLIQYVLAVDRNNRKVGPLYEPLHPAVIQCVANAVNAAKHAGKSVSICGEMAADPMCALLLVGLGLDDLSMGPFFIPIIKRLIRAASFETAQSLAEEALRLPTVKAVKSCVFEVMRDLGMIDIVEMYH